MLRLFLVELLNVVFDLVDAVELEPFRIDRIDELVHPVKEDSNALFYLLVAHQIGEVFVRIVTLIAITLPSLGSSLFQLFGEFILLLYAVVDAVDPEQVEHSKWILFKEHEVFLRDVASRAKEILDLFIEDFGRETVYSRLHVCLGSTPYCFEHCYVLLLVAVDEVLLRGLLHSHLSHGSIPLPVLGLLHSLPLAFGLYLSQFSLAHCTIAGCQALLLETLCAKLHHAVRHSAKYLMFTSFD